MMENRLLDQLRSDDPAQRWRQGWEAAMQTFPTGSLPFLAADYIHATCRMLGLEPPMEEAFGRARSMFEREDLRRLLWHFHRKLCLPAEALDEEELESWPALPSEIHAEAAMFYAFVLLSVVPHVRQLHAARGIPESVTWETLDDFRLWLRRHQTRRGVWGVTLSRWIGYHFRGKLFQLGRLQYQFASFNRSFRFYRNRHDRRVVALAGPGLRFRRDGQFDGANEITDPEAWTAEFRETAEAIVAHPMSPRGHAIREPVRLATCDWQQTLAPGDPVLAIHIQSFGPLDHAACGESFRRAAEFFPRYFPEHPVKAFTCASWLMDPQLEMALGPESNIARFQAEFYLLPRPGASDAGIFRWVFDGRPADFKTAPRDTRLQRAILDHVAAGKSWRDGLGVLLLEDLDWGSRMYRKAGVIYESNHASVAA